MKNRNISLLDEHQMAQRVFDEDQDAQRVTIVGMADLGQNLADSLKESLKESLKDINIVFKQPENTGHYNHIEYKEIKIPEIIKETDVQIVYVPQTVIEYREIEKPVIVTEIKVVEIEKPVIIKEIQVIEVPMIITESSSKKIELLMFAQTVVLIILSLIHFYHK